MRAKAKATIKAYVSYDVICPECGQSMALHIAEKPPCTSCVNPSCDLFGKDFLLPHIALKEK